MILISQFTINKPTATQTIVNILSGNKIHESMLHKFSNREKQQLSYVALLLGLLLLLWIIFAPNRGIVALYKAKKEIMRLQEENRRLAGENKVLQEEINRLQDDPAYLEEKARKEYGMLKENEVLYIFKKKEK
jgi:cell division protein FtsB